MESTLSTIASQLPVDIDSVVTQTASYIPSELADVIWHASRYIPTQIDILTVAKFLLYFAAASLLMGILGRIMLGQRSSLNHSLSSVMGILFIYAVTVVIYTLKPWNLDILLSPLPFVTFAKQYLIVLPITDVHFSSLCTQVLSLVILAFLVNLTDTFVPQGNNVVSWYLLRFITIALCMMLHFVVCWAFATYLPNFLVKYAPTVLLILLAVMMLSGLASLVLGLVIAVSNPFWGAMYTFFFSTVIGKQLSKAVFSSAILCVIVFLLEYFGYTVISITAAALLAYIPLALILLLLWYLIGHVL